MEIFNLCSDLSYDDDEFIDLYYEKSIKSMTINNFEKKELPKILNTCENITSLILENNEIENIKNLPQSLTSFISINNKYVNFDTKELPSNLKNITFENETLCNEMDFSIFADLIDLEIYNCNDIYEIKYPSKITYITLESCDINTIDNIPNDVSVLKLNNLNINEINKLPENLTSLYCSNMNINFKLEKLPIKLRTIIFSNVQFTNLCIDNISYNSTNYHTKTSKNKKIEFIIDGVNINI